jgi:putative FmdB family regulatory protein
MPLYEYECESCGGTFEVIQKFSDHSVDTCKTCGGKVRRLLSAPAIQFKGTGWYITDYARKGAGGAEKEKAAADKDKAGAATTESGASSSAAPSTPASGSDAKSASSAPATPAASSPSTTSTSDKK